MKKDADRTAPFFISGICRREAAEDRRDGLYRDGREDTRDVFHPDRGEDSRGLPERMNQEGHTSSLPEDPGPVFQYVR